MAASEELLFAALESAFGDQTVELDPTRLDQKSWSKK
jgi:hypothetical protein